MDIFIICIISMVSGYMIRTAQHIEKGGWEA